jgi:carbamoyl-phosphate synthase small subunit
MTYPLIGNYGFNGDDVESARPRVEGFVVKELCDGPSNWRSTTRPADYFRNHGIVGIRGVDTRALTQHLRSFGSMFGVISSERGDADALMRELRAAKARKRDLVAEVCTKEPRFVAGPGKRLAVLDFGVKESILRSLSARGCALSVLPAFSSPKRSCVRTGRIVLSNGPETRAIFRPVRRRSARCSERADPRDLSGASAPRPRARRRDVQAPVRTPRREPPRQVPHGRCAVTSQHHNYALRPDFSGDAPSRT